jgi:hypothetical protein
MERSVNVLHAQFNCLYSVLVLFSLNMQCMMLYYNLHGSVPSNYQSFSALQHLDATIICVCLAVPNISESLIRYSILVILLLCLFIISMSACFALYTSFALYVAVMSVSGA